MDKLQGVNKNHLSLVKNTSATSSTSSSSSSQAGKSAGSAPKADAAVLSSPATIVNITSTPTAQKVTNVEGPVRSYDDAKKLANSIAERVTGDEHGGLTPDNVRNTFHK